MPQIIVCEWRIIFSERLLHKIGYPIKDPCTQYLTLDFISMFPWVDSYTGDSCSLLYPPWHGEGDDGSCLPGWASGHWSGSYHHISPHHHTLPTPTAATHTSLGRDHINISANWPTSAVAAAASSSSRCHGFYVQLLHSVCPHLQHVFMYFMPLFCYLH